MALLCDYCGNFVSFQRTDIDKGVWQLVSVEPVSRLENLSSLGNCNRQARMALFCDNCENAVGKQILNEEYGSLSQLEPFW